MVFPKSLGLGMVVVNNDMKGQILFGFSLRKDCFYPFGCIEKS